MLLPVRGAPRCTGGFVFPQQTPRLMSIAGEQEWLIQRSDHLYLLAYYGEAQINVTTAVTALA